MPLKDVYDCARVTTAKVDTYQLVHVDKNRYSVPTPYVGKKVDVKIYPFTVVISYKNNVITQHERLFSKSKDALIPYHFLDLLMKKTRAFNDALVMKQWDLPEIFPHFHHMLKGYTKSNSKGTKEYIEVLKLTKTYGIERIKKILIHLDSIQRYSYEEVLSELRNEIDPHRQIILSKNTLKALGVENIKSSYLPLAQYNALTEGGDILEGIS